MDLHKMPALRVHATTAFLVFGALLAGCGGGSSAVPSSAPSPVPSPAASSAPVLPAVGERPPAIQWQVPARPAFIDTIPAPPPAGLSSTTAGHPPFFSGETPLGSIYYLALPNSNVFGYYSYLSDPRYIAHSDLGNEFVVDANDGKGGLYMYDFTSGHWWYTGRQFSFPYMYDFSLNALIYYYANTKIPGHYTTNPRSFYDFTAGATTTLSSTIVWQVGGGTLGQYSVPFPTDGQCSGVGPKIVGHNASFTMIRNKAGTYSYDGTTYPGGSTCYRNQMNPIDPNTGEIYLLQFGKAYVWTFTTVVNLNGNYLYQGALDGGLAGDIPMNVLQIHSYSGDGGACTTLDIQNTYVEAHNGITKYGDVQQGGRPVWAFHSCTEGDFGPGAYSSPDFIYDGEVDNWEIDAVPVQIGHGGGSWVVYRNGVQVYNTNGEACNTSSPQCFWNFGNYPYLWENTEEPPGWNDAGTTIQINDMTLRRK
jgi:hypothetical protein